MAVCSRRDCFLFVDGFVGEVRRYCLYLACLGLYTINLNFGRDMLLLSAHAVTFFRDVVQFRVEIPFSLCALELTV